MSGVNYDERLYRVYRAGRALSEDTGRLWMDAIGRHLGGRRPDLTVLDLGAGTGRFATMLAEAFDAQVVAVEPSEKMRAEAERHGAHPRVAYRDGAATAVPAADAVFDFAFLSMVIHHVPDIDACARGLHRVVGSGGLVFVRNVFAGRLDGIRHYEFFPSARAIDERRLPTVERSRPSRRSPTPSSKRACAGCAGPSTARPRRHRCGSASTCSSFGRGTTRRASPRRPTPP